jgi:hypothetical protein
VDGANHLNFLDVREAFRNVVQNSDSNFCVLDVKVPKQFFEVLRAW